MNATIDNADPLTQPPERERLSPDDLKLLDEFNRNKTQGSEVYSIEFTDSKIIIAENLQTDITCILKMDNQTVSGFKSTVEAIAQSGSRGPVTLRSNISTLEKALREVPTTSFTPESYQNLIKNKKDSLANTLHSLFNAWFRLGYTGMSSETIDTVNFLKRPSARPHARITSENPSKGWYTTEEYDDLIDTYWSDFESGKISLRNTTALLLNGQYGRRGVQMASLKVSDFQCEGETDGVSGKRVSFPGAKDRGAEEWFRGSKFETHSMGDDLWDLCQLQIADTISAYETFFQCELTSSERDQLPFFQKNPKKSNLADKPRFKPVPDNDSSSSYLHLGSTGISDLLKRERGTPVISQRTGQPVYEFAYRMRYTRARQLARLGVPRMTLQYWLGHENERSLEHYYNDPAEDARLLNEEMQVILAPLAQAFSGSIRDKETDATRGKDPSSRIELDGRHSVGSCGEHGYCSASVPVPCYRCSKFEPWVDAPHDEVLIRLIERQEEENNIRMPSKARRMLVPLQLDKDIAAVKLVIKLCDARKQELAKQEPAKQREANPKQASSTMLAVKPANEIQVNVPAVEAD